MLFFRKDRVAIRTRDQHNISRKNIDSDALKVLYRLSDSGYKAYLVGGGVRDLLLGLCPKDFDVGTDAHPREIKRLFRNCFLVGRRFRLAHIAFGRKVIETSTFRKQPPAHAADEDVPGGLYQSSDNTFGTPEEDAKRRDFTINGLFYDIKSFHVIDYVGGLKDLDNRVLRSIGDPNIRFREDPVRMLRAVRFASRLDLTMDTAVRRAIKRHAGEIAQAAVPRVLEEIFKLFGFASAAPAFRSLWETGLMAVLLPDLDVYVRQSGGNHSPLWGLLAALDAEAGRLPAGTDHHNGLRIAALYWPLFERALPGNDLPKGKRRGVEAQTSGRVLENFVQSMHPPKAVGYHARHLLEAQDAFDAPPPTGRLKGRLGMPEVLRDALTLARIRRVASGADASPLQAWEKLLKAPREGEPVREGRTKRRRRPRRRRKSSPADG